MKILVTAGGTSIPIDRVRSITNMATGRTGAALAWAARQRGHRVLLVTSQPAALDSLGPDARTEDSNWRIETYRTFDELRCVMAEALGRPGFDAVIHSAAVSDYGLSGTYVPAPGTRFDAKAATWIAAGPPALLDCFADKLKSDEAELWLRLVKAPKLIDLIRTEWKFAGIVVKFKLEVAVRDDELLEIAERSRVQSAADLMVANTLENAADYAFVGPVDGRYERVPRWELPGRLMDVVERQHRGRGDG